jgi:hypothetical protein
LNFSGAPGQLLTIYLFLSVSNNDSAYLNEAQFSFTIDGVPMMERNGIEDRVDTGFYAFGGRLIFADTDDDKFGTFDTGFLNVGSFTHATEEFTRYAGPKSVFWNNSILITQNTTDTNVTTYVGVEILHQ